ncbi:MAG: hypothetical protein IPH82_20625 [Chloroflexi bacterium]|nr:hypothetical protein [Chloroflexota bacterium]
MKTNKHVSTQLSLILALFISLAGCAAPAPPPAGACQPDTHGLIPLPTRALGLDPDLMQPPPAGGLSGGGACAPAETPLPNTSLTFTAAPLRNESIDPADQHLAAAAVGDDVLALAWLSGGDLFVSVARGGSFLQARRIAPAVHADLVFSAVNRLHLVYEQDGQIHYRAADLGARQAAFDFWRQVGPGHNPRLTLDANNRAHVFYELDGAIWHAEHQHDLYWHIARLGPGHTPRLTTFYDNPATPNTNERGFALSYLEGNTLHLRTYGTDAALAAGLDDGDAAVAGRAAHDGRHPAQRPRRRRPSAAGRRLGEPHPRAATAACACAANLHGRQPPRAVCRRPPGTRLRPVQRRASLYRRRRIRRRPLTNCLCRAGHGRLVHRLRPVLVQRRGRPPDKRQPGQLKITNRAGPGRGDQPQRRGRLLVERGQPPQPVCAVYGVGHGRFQQRHPLPARPA